MPLPLNDRQRAFLPLLLLLLTACSSKHRELAEVSCDAEETCGTLEEVYGDREQCLEEKRITSRKSYRQYRKSRSVECADAAYDYQLCYAEERAEECQDGDSKQSQRLCNDLYVEFHDLCD